MQSRITLLVSCTSAFDAHLRHMLTTVPLDVPVVLSVQDQWDVGSLSRSCRVVRTTGAFARGRYLNTAARAASRTNYFLIGDADFMYPPWFFPLLQHYLENSKPALSYVVCYVYKMTKGETTVVRTKISNVPVYSMERGTFFPSQNPLLIKREWFLETLGGYDERMTGYGAEDDDLDHRATRAGLTRVRAPLVCLHQDHTDVVLPPEYRAGRARNIEIYNQNDAAGVIRPGGPP